MAPRRCLIETLGAVTTAFLSIAVTIPAISAEAPPAANKNHTVGGPAGWFFNSSSNGPATNYSAWAANQTFYLGDYLIFNTNTNSTVVQTSNTTTFKLCDASSDDSNQTFLWGGDVGGSNSSAPTTEVMEIPLTYEGSNYFFSDTMDGEQCQNGMKFGIDVLHGNGLPPSLNQPPPPPYAKPPPPITSGGGGSGNSQSESSETNGAEGMRGGMVCAGLGMLSLVLMAV